MAPPRTGKGLAGPVQRPARRRKMKGEAIVELPDGAVVAAELHWYEAHGIGRRGMKIKKLRI